MKIEREIERERQTDRQTERQTNRQTETDRETERQTDRQTYNERDRDCHLASLQLKLSYPSIYRESVLIIYTPHI